MISAGAMNRRVRIEEPTYTRDPESKETMTAYVPVASVCAHRRDTSAREFMSMGERVAEQVAVFTLWWRDGITTRHRLVTQGQAFDITGLVEIGQRYQLQVQAQARADAPTGAP